ncbi:MAG TPA: hypothetical protein VGV68_04200 [Terriglobia bacterium]|nr:hypothetical protein [Terriglobia bacterium]
MIREIPWNKRKTTFKQGLLWAAGPIAIFIPAIGIQTVYPPTSAESMTKIVLFIFIGSELLGLWKLIRAIDWRLGTKTDVLDVLALPVVILGAIVLAASLYGLIAILLHHG